MPATLLMHPDEKSALIINYKFSDFSKLEYTQAEQNKKLETLYYIQNKTYNSGKFFSEIKIEHRPRSPFINASHNLQIASNDNNCVLYSLNFINGLIAMLQNDSITKEILEFCQEEVDVISLRNIFREKLKFYLPCYYNKDGSQKSSEEIKLFHLQQRWNLAKTYLKYFFPLRIQANSFFYNPDHEEPIADNNEPNPDLVSSQEFFV